MCCGQSSSFRRHEKRINVPELISAGGSLYPHRDPFSLTWLYTKILFWFISLALNIYCYITCLFDTNYYSFFLYYNNWVLLLTCFYFTFSLILSIQIYQNTQPYHLPSCLQPINQYARSNINDLPSIKNLKLSLLHKYTNITFHLSVTNTFVLCIAYWTVEFVHSIHDFEHFYKFPMKLNVISNYAILLLLILFEYSINASKLNYSAIWYILIMSLIFHIWSSVFNYNAFLYQNDNDNSQDISNLPRLFIYYNWDQTKLDNNNNNIVTHSLFYIIFVSFILYIYIITTHFILCFIKSLSLYKWSTTNQAYLNEMFETEFELNEFSDATALDDEMYEDKVALIVGNGIVGNGIIVHEKIKDTNSTNITDDKDSQQEINP
eukprot:212440_1